MAGDAGFRAYWRRVHRRAFADATRTLGLESRAQVVIKSIATIAIILALLFWGSEDASIDEIIVRVAIVSCFLISLLGVYAWNFVGVPSQMEREAQSTINELREHIVELEEDPAAALEFDFRPEDNKFLALSPAGSGTGSARYAIGRVATKNLYDTEPVPNVRTVLIHYRTSGEGPYITLDIWLTSYSSGLQVEDVPPRQSVTYDLFRVGFEDGKYTLDLGPNRAGQYKRVPLGRYRLKITAASTKQGVPHLPSFFLLSLNEHGEVEYGPWRDVDRHIRRKINLDLD